MAHFLKFKNIQSVYNTAMEQQMFMPNASKRSYDLLQTLHTKSKIIRP